jgi:hypothetical protein
VEYVFKKNHIRPIARGHGGSRSGYNIGQLAISRPLKTKTEIPRLERLMWEQPIRHAIVDSIVEIRFCMPASASR